MGQADLLCLKLQTQPKLIAWVRRGFHYLSVCACARVRVRTSLVRVRVRVRVCAYECARAVVRRACTCWRACIRG
jgi:hypothetical protein